MLPCRLPAGKIAFREGNRMKRLTTLMLLPLLLASCAPVETTRKDEAMPEVAVRPRGTYALVSFEETVAVGVFNPKILEGLEGAVAEGMAKKGYTSVTESPDLLVALYVVREEKFQSHDWGYKRGWKTPEWDAYWLKRRAAGGELAEGTIVIDLLDARSRQHIWGKSSDPVLFPSAEGEVENRAAEMAVMGMLAALP